MWEEKLLKQCLLIKNDSEAFEICDNRIYQQNSLILKSINQLLFHFIIFVRCNM